jgi:hypothetical protein
MANIERQSFIAYGLPGNGLSLTFNQSEPVGVTRPTTQPKIARYGMYAGVVTATPTDAHVDNPGKSKTIILTSYNKKINSYHK